VGLQRRAGVVDGGGDEEEAAACAGAVRGGTGGGVGGSGGEEVGEDGLDGVVGAEDVDVDDGFEGIEGEVGDGGEEVACCSGSGGMMVRDLMDALEGGAVGTYMQKSMPPNSLTQASTALFRLSGLRTSTEPIPRTFEPSRAVMRDLATDSVFSTFRPTMQALAPRWTIART
jgi:hypothetical protein